MSDLTSYRGSNMALLHKVKGSKSLSLSDYGSGYPLFPEGGVVWKIPYYLKLRLWKTLYIICS